MGNTAEEIGTLEKVHQIGMSMDEFFDEDLIFAVLAPQLNNLMKLLKKTEPAQMQQVFMEYEGVARVMRMIEDSAQDLEKELGAAN